MSPADLPQGREGHEPAEAPRGVPLVVAGLVVVVAAWGAYTFATEIGPGMAPYGDRRTLAALQPPETPAGGGIDGGAVFAARCAACHQADGNGLPGTFPPLAGSEWVVGAPERTAAIVLTGLTGAIEVKGTSYASVMPTFRDQLTDGEIAAVLSHVRGSFGNAATPVPETLVAGVRATLEGHAPLQGQAELVQLYP
ncbi:MAG: cytochrome c [Alphaproteobacteria bacterium]|nr:cytochrome c [Alphaproteobacteria bacterium]MCB9700093.1 cytochrome c [Alphaproteobacteria bacterium]